VPPLIQERRQHLSPSNPLFVHVRMQAWLAFRGAEPVGRISAQIDQLYLEQQDAHTGFFGMLEAHDDPEVFGQLLATAEDWLRGQGMRRVLGPFNLSINDQSGLLVAGFDTPPSVLMGHGRPYYPGRVEAAGYRPIQDLLAYRIATDFVAPPAVQSLLSKAEDQVRLRPLRRKRQAEDFQIMRDIFNDAWSENWGYVPFTEAEFRHIGEELAPMIPDDFVQIAEMDGEPAGMIVMLPNINEAIRDLNGRLLPHGWLKLLWRLKIRHPQSARVPLMGVRKRHQLTLFGGALTFMLIEAVRRAAQRRGVREVELSWVLEQNRRMCDVIEALGGNSYKRYRLYEKTL